MRGNQQSHTDRYQVLDYSYNKIRDLQGLHGAGARLVPGESSGDTTNHPQDDTGDYRLSGGEPQGGSRKSAVSARAASGPGVVRAGVLGS